MHSDKIQTSIEHLYRELEGLKQNNAGKKAQIAQLREQIEAAITQRDTLNAEVKEISNKVRELKSMRDALNAKVKELKQKRDELRNAASEKRQMLTRLLEQARGISEQVQGSMSELSRQIRQLEWYIQTNALAPKTERNLIAKIGTLEANLTKHKGLGNVRDKLLRLRIEVGALRIQAQSTHEELTKIAQESEEVHTSMQELVKNLTEKKREADQKHAEYLELSKERHEIVGALKRNLVRIDEIRAQIGETRTSSKVEKAEKLKSKYRESANEKLRTGGKLSLEEFQALMADTLSDSDEDSKES